MYCTYSFDVAMYPDVYSFFFLFLFSFFVDGSSVPLSLLGRLKVRVGVGEGERHIDREIYREREREIGRERER